MLLQNKAVMLILDVIKGIYPSVFTGCPYEGLYETKWVDVNDSLSPLLPPVVPAGVFRVYFHFNTHTNISIFSLQVETLLKATKEYRATDFSFLNMG